VSSRRRRHPRPSTLGQGVQTAPGAEKPAADTGRHDTQLAGQQRLAALPFCCAASHAFRRRLRHERQRRDFQPDEIRRTSRLPRCARPCACVDGVPSVGSPAGCARPAGKASALTSAVRAPRGTRLLLLPPSSSARTRHGSTSKGVSGPRDGRHEDGVPRDRASLEAAAQTRALQGRRFTIELWQRSSIRRQERE